MKFKQILSYFILICIILSVSVFPHAEDVSPLFYDDFEQETSFSSWLGATADENAAYEGKWGAQVLNPYGDDTTPNYGHILDYTDFIDLEKGKFYTFSAYVMNPSADDASDGEATSYIGRGGEELFIDISSVGFNWTRVTSSFVATDDISPSLVITFEGGDIDTGFFIDSVSITPEDKSPQYIEIDGPESVFIPYNGSLDYRYNLIAYDEDDNRVNILLNDVDVTVDKLPEGLEFDENTGYLRVFSEAPASFSFTITFSAVLGDLSDDASITVTTTHNLLSDASFENGEENWVCDGDIDYVDGTVSLYADQSGEFGKYTSISYTKQLFLQGGKMYVFRADVRSEDEYSSSSVFISNLSFASSGYAEINITGIGGEWSRVTSAFLIEDTGLYDLTLNLYAPSERPIFIDNVFLGAEEEAPTSLSIHAPGNICIPSEKTVLPCYSNVLNQMGEVMEGREPRVTIKPEEDGVYLEDDCIVVEANATPGDYIVTSSYDEILSTHILTVSHDAVGDGSFEEKEANEWWTASDGAIFSIIDYDGGKAGHVYSEASSCIVINNSYMELIEGEYYVYSAGAGFGEGTVTAFIADAYTGEYIPFAQYDPLIETKIPFSVDSTVLGRLVLYIESEGSIGLLFDDISIEPVELSANEITIRGGEYGENLRGNYVYVNNMTDSSDADISATRWYISPSYDGHYEPIGIPNQNYLEFSEDMVGQYIIYEVTPICAYSGLIGDSLRSLPVQVAAEITDDPTPTDRPLSEMTPLELGFAYEHPFSDITDHWCEDMIASLSAAGIVSGRANGKFVPDFSVTRAEFTAMVARAFSLVSMPYSDQFDDVSASDWYSGWIEAAYRRGIIKGIDAKTFAPNEKITREQMATILYRAYLLAKGPLPYDLELKYYDAFMISPWAYESVKNCTNLNLFKGDDLNLFRPEAHATRAEAAAVIYRTLKCF